jgi:hypothetical protein
MTKLDEAEFKRVISSMERRQPEPEPLRRVNLSSKNQRAIGKLLEPVLAKAGFPAGKLTTMLAQNQKELRDLFQQEKAEATKHFSAAEAAYRARVAARAEALELLSKPFTSSFITLAKPFLIWELPKPQLDIFIESQAEALNSSINILVNTNSGSNNTQFVFYFLWQNDSDFSAVINASTSVIFNGNCEVDAAPGIFSGDTSTLNLSTSLTTMRWSGWGNDPTTGQSNNQTPYPSFQPSQFQTVAALQTQGGAIFGDQGVSPKGFTFEPFDLHEDMIIVPGRAVTVFEVAVNLSYGFDDGGNISDLVFVDFANNGNSIRCPFVQLELLTAPPD